MYTGNIMLKGRDTNKWFGGVSNFGLIKNIFEGQIEQELGSLF